MCVFVCVWGGGGGGVCVYWYLSMYISSSIYVVPVSSVDIHISLHTYHTAVIDVGVQTCQCPICTCLLDNF